MSIVIVIADSDEASADELAQHLKGQGHEVHIASGGKSAFELVVQHGPDLVIADVMLSGIDGFALCKNIHQDRRTNTSAIILTTSQPIASEKVRGLNLGADDYLTKPFDMEVLDAHVQSVLRRALHLKDLSPLTKLPGKYRIANEIERLVADADSQYAVIECDINNFKSYNDRYGFNRGDEVIKFLGSLVSDIVHEYGETPNIVGHGGGDDFIIICSPSAVENVCKKLIERFDRGITGFYDDVDVENGYVEIENRKREKVKNPICTIAIGAVSTEFHDINTQWEASVTASEMRVFAKRNNKSSYEVDRRRTDDQFAAMLDGQDRRGSNDEFKAMIDGNDS